MIIKAGTYRFNDELTTLSTDGDITQKLPFTATLNSTTYTLGSITLGLRQDIDLEFAVMYNHTNDVNQYRVYWGGWSFGREFYGENVQIFTVTADTEVDDTFATWFTENTTMLIKAGTYRWNDIPKDVSNINEFYPISLTLPDVSVEGETLSLSYDGVVVSNGRIGYRDYLSSPDDYNSIYYYNQESRWDSFYYSYLDAGYDFPSLRGYGQIFTVTADTYVPTNFGLWANENWKKHEVKKKFTRLYLGDVAYSSGGKCFKRLSAESGELADLTGTAWYVPSDWDTVPGYGSFSVDYIFTIPDDFDYGKGVNCSGFHLGYNLNSNGLRVPAGDWICFTPADGYEGCIGTVTTFSVTFNGGDDVTNADLIAWLYANGELQ